MAAHQQQQQPQGGYDYSTLEVDDARLPETVVQPPVAANPDLNNYPEVIHPPGYQEVKPYDAYRPYPGADNHDGGGGATGAAAGSKIWGLKRRTFWILVGAGAVIIIAIIVGVVAGLLAPRSGSSTSTDDSDSSTGSDNSSSTSETAILPNTKLASANFTDGLDNENYLVVYQVQNRAIYISAYNSSTDKWVVSPIIDGSTSVSLDDVQEETGLGLDVYYHDSSVSN